MSFANVDGIHPFEHNNLYLPMKKVCLSVNILQAYEVLREIEKDDKFFLFETFHSQAVPIDVLQKRILYHKPGQVFVHFCTDDDWQFPIFSRYICPYYHFIATNNPHRVREYAEMGIKAFFFQYGCNQEIYKKIDLPKKYDVIFIGAPHSNRAELIRYLILNGVKVTIFGPGWNRIPGFSKYWGGYLKSEDMIKVINQSKIVLNFLTTSTKEGKAIKGKLFEFGGCGAFQICDEFSELEKYYKTGEEIITFSDKNDLLKKIRFYLDKPEEGQRIALAGYTKTLKEHTMEKRFQKLFEQIQENSEICLSPPQIKLSSSSVTVIYKLNGKTISQEVISCLEKQTFRNFNLMVISDEEVNCNNFSFSVRIVSTKEFSEIQVNTDYVCFIEDGDIWQAQKLEFHIRGLDLDGKDLNLSDWEINYGKKNRQTITFRTRYFCIDITFRGVFAKLFLPSAVMITSKLFSRINDKLKFINGNLNEELTNILKNKEKFGQIDLGQQLLEISEKRFWRILKRLSFKEKMAVLGKGFQISYKIYMKDLLRHFQIQKALMLVVSVLWMRYRKIK